ncbi:hypothetical protein HKBW3S42_01096 [Candidatus Hakubella thermalkaliphila]|uniref:Uncharacterized protein n=1 Tax=Candidatus Hakubella thermalkaliphila TaxID=2754717 RepID=A0A6V8PKI9_9ACTN|nr:hypothetical protein HKBW3S42_01096 [Candidatus Hakubella thermalkaliphila]
METKRDVEIIEEIKHLERELYLKRSKLASEKAMKYGVTLPSLVGSGLDFTEWKKVLSELIKLIGMHSVGGDSVEDVKKERGR